MCSVHLLGGGCAQRFRRDMFRWTLAGLQAIPSGGKAVATNRVKRAPAPARGRPSKTEDLTSPDVLRQVEELAGYGLTQEQIAAVIGLSERTLRRRKEDTEVFSAAIQRGKAKASAEVGKSLFRRAKEGEVSAIRWWEMTRDGRSERSQAETKIEVTHDAETEARLARIMGDALAKQQAANAGEADAGTAG
jgi:transcriptional regulator with XRE-family HTH domain